MRLLDWYRGLVDRIERRREERRKEDRRKEQLRTDDQQERRSGERRQGERREYLDIVASSEGSGVSAAPPLRIGKDLPSRLIHVGVDYGTSWSKMVFRDYEAPGGEQSHVIFESDAARIRGEFRFPSLVVLAGNRLWFGSQAVGRAEDSDAVSWSSVKIRMALPAAFYGREVPLPDGLSTDDLATLTVVYLLQHARRSVEAYCNAHRCAGRMSFTLGVPMSDFDNPKLRDRFSELARVAAAVERSAFTPDLRGGIDAQQAQTIFVPAREQIRSTPTSDSRNWIRPEVEAALLWPFKCPDTTSGLYAAIDVGAGTTSASFFWITQAFEGGAWVKSGLAFSGSSCLPPGGDAIDAALSKAEATVDPAVLRGRENEVIARMGAGEVKDVVNRIFETYRISFSRGYAKDKRQSSWEHIRMFLLGGGTEIDCVKARVATRPWLNLHHEPDLMNIECPHDLHLETIKAAEHKFLLVAYGLSHIDVDIPTATMSTDVPPLDLRRRSVIEMDRDNPDEFRPVHN